MIRTQVNKVIEGFFHKTKDEKDISSIFDKVDNSKYVSFDIFDTLIKRNIHSPTDLFKFVELKYKQLYSRELNNFSKDRINAEIEARKHSEKEQTTLEEIYSMLPGYSYKDKQTLKKIECELEIELSTRNKKIYEVYSYCLKKNKKIILISDMYLPKNTIIKLLKNNGISKFEKLYLSSEIGLQKRTSSLFKHVLNELDINPKDMIHIGDNVRSDYLAARKLGVNTILIPNYFRNIRRTSQRGIEKKDQFSYKSIKAFINNNVPIGATEYYRFGYETFGLLLYGYTRWMLNDLIDKGIKKVYFFSRDGYVMKRAFDLLNPYKDIKSYYLYGSRRAYRVPQLWSKPELSDVIKTFPLTKLLTLKTFLLNLGLNPEEYKSVLAKYGFTLEHIIKRNEILKNNKIILFYNEIKEDVIKNSEYENKMLLKYLEQNQFEGKVAVVDIGWHGSLQYFLNNIVEDAEIPVEMFGYYVGLSKKAREDIDIKGYVVDPKSDSCDSWRAYNGLIESIFLAQEGSTKKFKEDNENNIVPVLYKYEYFNNGKYESESKKVSDIQEGAIKFVEDIFKCMPLQLLKFSSTTAYRDLYLAGIKPTKYELEMFSDFRFFAEQIDLLAMPNKISHYILHPRNFVRDLNFSRWKVGFLKKLFKIPLPYEKIYKILKKLN